MGSSPVPVRLAGVGDTDDVARLLHDFNTEFDTPSPGPEILARRLRSLLAGRSTFAVLAGTPGVAVALVTLHTNVWSDGPVALLDELYVEPDRRGSGIGSSIIDLVVAEARRRDVDSIEINVDEGDVDAQRFYRRHGFSDAEPDTGERAFYFSRDLAG